MATLANAFASLFSGIGTTYSFKDLSGAMTSPLAGAFTFSGEIGSGKITVENTTDHGAIDTAADGTVVPGYVAGNAGRITIECQQTSVLHKFLLYWFNLHNTVAGAGNVAQWAGSALLLRNTVDGSSHVATGVTPTKVPDKAYDKAPGNVTWTLNAANLVNA
jgi:Protein of unknown function (DUF3277)